MATCLSRTSGADACHSQEERHTAYGYKHAKEKREHGEGCDTISRSRHDLSIDLSNAYEQVCVEPADVWKTSFSTVQGMYESLVMQQGDCNAPSTFQRLMNRTFIDYIGKFVHAYMDDIFVFSESIKEHQEHLKLMFEKLHENSLYLCSEKCQIFAESVECLYHIIDEKGLHADRDKMARI